MNTLPRMRVRFDGLVHQVWYISNSTAGWFLSSCDVHVDDHEYAEVEEVDGPLTCLGCIARVDKNLVEPTDPDKLRKRMREIHEGAAPSAPLRSQ